MINFPCVQKSEYLIKSFQITLLLRIYVLQAGIISLTGMKNTNSELFELCHTLFSLIVKAFLLLLTIYSLGFLLQSINVRIFMLWILIHKKHCMLIQYSAFIFSVVKKNYFSLPWIANLLSLQNPQNNKSHDKTKQHCGTMIYTASLNKYRDSSSWWL